MRLKVLFAAVMLAGATCATLPAAAIFGTFNLAGNATVSANGGIITIAFAELVSNTPGIVDVGSTVTGSFSGLQGTMVAITDLDSGTQPVGPPFSPADDFLTFLSAPPGFPVLQINQVFPGVFGSAACSVPPTPAVGQTCTPGPGSPFNLINTPGTGGTPIQSTASFSVGGVTSDGLSTWTGVISANFNTPYQTQLANFANNGSVTQTFSGTFIVTPTAVPEAGTLSLLGLGLVGISLKLRRRA